jgi:diguanylate cyclase (GGDEF)-like protein/PAS domain S-box-containing protein
VGTRRTLAWLLATVAAIAFGAVAVFASGSHLAVVVDDLGTTSAAAVAAASCLFVARRCPTARSRRGWLLVGLACGSWSAGNVIWAYFELVLHQEAPFPSPADLGYLGFVPLAVAGVALLGPSFASVGTLKRVLDVALITVSLAGVGWIVVLAPVAENTEGWLERGLSLAYPIGDLVMLAVILSVTAVARERNRALGLLLGGLVLFALADVAFAYTTATEAYESGSLPAWAWFTGFLAIALAARPAEATADVDLTRPQWLSEVVTHVPVIAVGALLIGQQVRSGRVSSATVALIFVVGLLNAFRHLAANRQNAALTQALGGQVTALQEEQERAHRVIDEARDPYVELDRDGRIMVWNAPAEQVFGWKRDEVVGHLIGEIVPEEMRQASRERIAAFVETGDPEIWEDDVDVRYLRPDGTEVPIAIAAWHTGADDAYRIHAFVWDISERVAEQELLEASERRWRSLIQHSSDITVVLDADGTVINEVPNQRPLLGYQVDENKGHSFTELLHPDDLSRVLESYARVVDEPGGKARIRLRLRRIDGSWASVEAIASNLLDDPDVGGVVCNLRDVTAQVAAENELKRQARRDPLTGLPNRNLMTDALARQCLVDDGSHAALLLMDLDGFKDINDGLGHDIGDQLLVEIGHRLDRVTRADDVVARLGGDEFAVLLTRLSTEQHAEKVAENLGGLIREPIRLGNVTLEVGVSIGIAECAAGDDPLAVLQRADVAMYRAKRQRSGHAVYGSGDDEERRNSVKVAAELRSAIDHGHLVVHYQPKVELATGLVDSVEALVRWNHPERGLLPPDEFIALAERTGLIRDLTDKVLDVALHQCATWRSEGLDIPVAVNLSPRLLGQSDLVGSIRESLQDAGVPAGRLTLEITESAFPENSRVLSATLDQLGALGVRLSVDDFGTGFSSLSKLKELPVQELKIDKSFVFALAEDATDHSIVRSIIELARSLNLTVVAEGVETPEVLELLGSLGCPLAQGYLFSKPIPGPGLTGWMLAWDRERHERMAGEGSPRTTSS